MVDDVYVYFVSLPEGISETVVAGICQYTIYINKCLSDAKKKEAYEHALRHIEMGHFDIDCTLNVDQKEIEAHYGIRYG